MFRAIDPWLAVPASFRAMIAVDGVEHAKFHPTRKQFGSWAAGEPANIIANERVARESKVEQLRNRNPHVIPCAAVVPGTCGRITLRSRVGGTGQHKRTNVRLQAQQTLVGSSRVLHSEHVVDLP